MIQKVKNCKLCKMKLHHILLIARKYVKPINISTRLYLADCVKQIWINYYIKVIINNIL